MTGSEGGGLRPENVIWIFGTGRTGSSWLMEMLASLERHQRWSEPFIGELFGGFRAGARADQLRSANFILGEPHRATWLDSIRDFILQGADARFPGLTADDYLVIKESTASRGAPLLVEAMPQSRVILLIRDPRDVIASLMDGLKGWMLPYVDSAGGRTGVANAVEQQTDLFVQRATENLVEDISSAREAHDRHRGPKAVVRYEDLRANSLDEMRRIRDALALAASDEELARVVEEHSWERIPAAQKGKGKFFRKASPGSWSEDLTPEQAERVRAMTSTVLTEY